MPGWFLTLELRQFHQNEFTLDKPSTVAERHGENLQENPDGYTRVVPDTGIETVSPERIQTLDKPSLLPKGMEKICKKILMGPSGWFLIRKP